MPLVVLTGIIEPTTNAWLIFLILGFFGLGAGLGMPAMTDTVMAAVPERDAGVGSALNDVSRQLGGALGVAIIGSVVNDAYRSNLADHAGDLDPGVVHAAGEGIGVASRVAATLPPEGAAAADPGRQRGLRRRHHPRLRGERGRARRRRSSSR